MNYINMKLAKKIRRLLNEMGLCSPLYDSDKKAHDIFIARLLILLEEDKVPSGLPVRKCHTDKVLMEAK